MDTLQTLLLQAWSVTGAFAPWLLLGLAVAGLLHLLLPADFVRRHLGGNGFLSVFKAALFGVPLPLCSCGVIPATIGLKQDGASAGAAVGFLISTPQTGVDSIMVSAAFLGWPFALFKVIAAFVTGLFGGWLVDVTRPSGDAGAGAQPEAETSRRPKRPDSWREWLAEFYRFTAIELLGSIWRWVALGIVVSAAISTVFPENALADSAWVHGPLGMLLMLAVALPLYVCATASVPIAAALVAAGMPPGAALVFLMAGPASNAATIGAIYKAFGKRVVAIYLGVIIVASLGFGYLFNFLLRPGYRERHVHLHGGPGGEAAGIFWAALLTLILAACAVWEVRRWWRRRHAPPAPVAAPGVIRLRVTGMTCPNCARHVREALAQEPGVTAVEVDLERGTAVVHGDGLDPDALLRRVAAAGYAASR